MINNKINKIESLLGKTEVVYFKFKNEMFETQNEFNIFSLLRKPHDEVMLHSKFIAELLSPKGTHKLNGRFLHLFIDKLNIKNFKVSDDFAGVEVKVECGDGVGGRIDVFINNQKSKQAIIIENKIYAEDQSKQLQRYYDYAFKRLHYKKEDITIVYLTLYGDSPTQDSLGDLSAKDVLCRSYKDDIDLWVSECIATSALKPIIRETLNQYQNLVRKLTGKSMSDNYINDLTKLLNNNPDYVSLVGDLSEALEVVNGDSQIEFWNKITGLLDNNHNINEFRKWNESNVRKFYGVGNVPYYGISLSLNVSNLSDDSKIVLHVGVESREMFIGVTLLDKNNSIVALCDKEEYTSYFNLIKDRDSNYLRSKYWIAWKYFDDKDFFKNKQNMSLLNLTNEGDRNKMIEIIIKEVESMVCDLNG